MLDFLIGWESNIVIASWIVIHQLHIFFLWKDDVWLMYTCMYHGLATNTSYLKLLSMHESMVIDLQLAQGVGLSWVQWAALFIYQNRMMVVIVAIDFVFASHFKVVHS